MIRSLRTLGVTDHSRFPLGRPARGILLALGVMLAAAGLGGCPLSPPNSAPPKLSRFQSADELLTYYRQQVNARVSRASRVSLFGGGLFGVPTVAPAEDAAGGAGEGDNSADFTSTNLQEDGVDESDIFKNDGTYFYIARNDTVRIVQAAPLSALAEVARVELGFNVSDLFLYQNTLIAIGADYGGNGPITIEIWPPYMIASKTRVAQIALDDPTAPTVTTSVEFDGAFVSARLIGDRLTLITTYTPNLPDNPTPLAVSRLSLDDVTPEMRVNNGEASAAVSWQGYYRPSEADGFNTTVVLTLDAANVANVVNSTALLADAGTIYASPESLYVTSTDYNTNGDYRESTAIHKLSLNADGASYVGSGSVPGHLLNQFSLGEKNGYLRVATHDFGSGFGFGGGIAVDVAASPEPSEGGAGSAPGSPAKARDAAQAVNQPANAVYVLGESEDALAIVGRVENIAPGERIYAARFLGDRGFLVTFVQIDPLFALDLSDPTNPRILGELKVPGFSDYLHPLGEDRLIGVGRSVVDGRARGVQLSLFDVSDLTNPTMIQQVELGGWGSISDVSWTHKAFGYLASQALMVIPAELTPTNTGQFEYAPAEFDGVLGYTVDPASGFTQRATLKCVGHDDFSYVAWRRAAVIGDNLYAISPNGVRAAPLNDTTAAVQVVLTD